ncbi:MULTISPECIES: type II toxin-antitoxin system VapC family toxin [Hyphobacterium]|uniref:Type II toxin-antitoxin system VapC family toxin n=1 Tax=Hyphobacterium vulgare TaxID=1736751 RepID=A0ABV6ZY44_9PROT
MPVVDANVALAWAVPSSRTQSALHVLESPGDIIAPTLLVHEVANAVWLMINQQLIAPDEGEAIRAEAIAPVRILESDRVLAWRALQIAAELRHPAYDAFYLAVAEAESMPFITGDRRLIARAAGSPYASMIRELGG